MSSIKANSQMTFKQEVEHLDFLIQRVGFMSILGTNEEAYKKCRETLKNIKKELEELEDVYNYCNTDLQQVQDC